ncbi:MAG: hypothetical protein AAGF14_01435 [Pseudomonadota bacterium]
MQPSMTALLVAIELGFVLLLARRSSQLGSIPGGESPVYVYLVWLAGYAIITSYLGARGLYVSAELLRLLPALWLQLITVAAVVLPLVLFTNLRQQMRQIVDDTPLHWFAWFHGLRIGALGTAYKTSIGEFPVYFELFVGIPDFLFGLSAFWVAARLRKGLLSQKSFMYWNLIGALIIVPSAPILLQLGLPGPLQLFTSLPDARAVFTFPMSIAPMIGVPLFVLINLWVAWRLWERSRTKVAIA